VVTAEMLSMEAVWLRRLHRQPEVEARRRPRRTPLYPLTPLSATLPTPWGPQSGLRGLLRVALLLLVVVVVARRMLLPPPRPLRSALLASPGVQALAARATVTSLLMRRCLLQWQRTQRLSLTRPSVPLRVCKAPVVARRSETTTRTAAAVKETLTPVH
jgi:hypothetical protein